MSVERPLNRISLAQEMSESYLEYAMSTIISRALPDVRDGLKPVQRRILVTMNDLNLGPNRKHLKCAKVAGQTSGDYHPHGEQNVYPALVRMAQDFSMRYPLVDGQGNFGCFTGDTKIKLVDGTEKSFAELAELDPTTVFYVYSVNEQGRIVIGEGRNARVTRRGARLMELTLDNGATIRCTPDHRFMLRDGTYRAAKDLTPEDSLMPGYFDTAPIKEGLNEYLRVLQPATGEYEFVHHLADEFNQHRGVVEEVSGPFVRHHAKISKRMKALWQDPDYRARMSEALSDVEKRELTPEEEARVAQIISEKSRAMWRDEAKRAEIMEAISQAMSSDEVRKRLSEIAQRHWRNPDYRAKFPEEHFSNMARALWADPATRQKHREKIARQWKDEVFRKAQREGVQHSNRRRLLENPQMMSNLAAQAAESLVEKWADPTYKQQVMRRKIVGYGARLVAKIGYENVTPAAYEAYRDANWIPHLEKALQYFRGWEELLEAARTYNHRVISKRWLEEKADVYDITVDKYHNFLLASGVFVHNSVDGDPPAAMRYTEARLTPLAMEMLADLEKETVDYRPNYDERLEEPVVLPSKFPCLLCNGNEGIAVGMTTKIPPHNLNEVVEGICAYIDNPDITNEELMEYIPGPDFPTYGLILGTQGIREMYTTGQGNVVMQARAAIEPIEGGRTAIIVTELPYQVNKARLQEQIAELVNKRRIEGISALRDESDRNGMRLVIELRRDATPHVVLNNLYKHTALRASFPAVLRALVDNTPRLLDLKGLIREFVEHRRQVVTRRTRFELQAAEARAHILEGLLVALDHIDAVIALIRSSANRTEARDRLRQEFQLSDKQAQAIVEMALGTLTGLERQKIENEHREVRATIAYLQGLLADPRKILRLIKEEEQQLARKYGDERRTVIRPEEADDIRIQDLIAEEEMAITLTRDGYAKRLPLDTYRVQQRGGKGILALTKKEEDVTEHLFVATTHHYLLFFTDRGRVYRLRAYEVPQASRTARGTPIINLIQIEPGEQVTAVIPVPDLDQAQGYLFFVTQYGVVKRTSLDEFRNIHRGGILAMNIPDNDALRWVRWTDGRQEIILATRDGMSIRFPETDVRPMGRNATGVRGIRLRRHDEVVACQIVDARRHALVVSQGGYGKRTPFEEYRQQARGGIGIITYKVTAKTGSVVGLEVVDDGDELMLLTEQGVLIRIPVAPIRETGRSAQGVKLIDLAEGDWVKAVSKVVRRDEELLPEKPFRLLEVPSPSPVPAQELTEEEWEEESQAGPDLHLVE